MYMRSPMMAPVPIDFRTFFRSKTKRSDTNSKMMMTSRSVIWKNFNPDMMEPLGENRNTSW